MFFAIYKRGQGKYTRLCSAFAIGLIAAIGCLQLYRKLEASELGLWTETMVPAGLFVALCLLVFHLVNRRSIADFMVAAEGEVKKVSWSSRKEVMVSTCVVIVVVALMACLLGSTDFGFTLLFQWLLG
jgi:preprotein translocase subunit SecE